MLKKISGSVAYVVLISFILSFIISPAAVFAASNKVPTGQVEIYKNREIIVKKFTATQEQVDVLKKNAPPDLEYVKELPEGYNKFFIKLDQKLGGGFLMGDEDKIAYWLNKAGITVGITPAALAGGDGGVFVIVALAILAVLFASKPPGGGGGGTNIIPPATH